MSSTGTVKWYSAEKGYGFIQPDDGGEVVFAHHSEIKNSGYPNLEVGQRVEYDVTEGPKGRQAHNICVFYE